MKKDKLAILVTGDRYWTNERWLRAALKARFHQFNVLFLIHGAARGADTIAGEYAAAYGIQPVACPALWDKFDRSAGPIRNQSMARLLKALRDSKVVDKVEVVAFHTDLKASKGTLNMVKLARKYGFTITLIDGTEANGEHSERDITQAEASQ